VVKRLESGGWVVVEGDGERAGLLTNAARAMGLHGPFHVISSTRGREPSNGSSNQAQGRRDNCFSIAFKRAVY
jgi:hypothetical protein